MNTETEKSQEQIRFELMCMNLITGDFRGYKRENFKSIGNIIHWLRAVGLIQYDTVQIGWNSNLNHGNVTLWGRTICTYTFDEENKRPILNFISDYSWCQQMYDSYINGLPKYENPFKKYES